MKALRKTLQAARRKARRDRAMAKAHRRYNKDAMRILAGLETELPAQTRDLCDAYASDVLGAKTFAPWLYVYSAIAGEFRDGWIPENYFRQYHVNKLSYRRIGGPRGLNRFFFEAAALPDIAYIIDGRVILTNGEFVDPGTVAQVLFAQSDRVIFKADYSRQGLGVQFFERNSFEPAKLKSMGNGVFQRIVTQHPAFDPISQNALLTLRLTTAHNEQGQFSVRGAFLRTGRSADRCVTSKSSIRVAFDDKTGALSDTGYFPNWTSTDHHPDTQVKFDGMHVPSIQACTDLAIRLHRQMPYVQCVGWDIAVDASGAPQLLEWNTGHTGIKFSEAIQGPCFADLGWQDLWRNA